MYCSSLTQAVEIDTPIVGMAGMHWAFVRRLKRLYIIFDALVQVEK
jgi:hypothetical protein